MASQPRGSYPLDWTFFKEPKTGEFQEWPWRQDQLGKYQKLDPAQAKQLLEGGRLNNAEPARIRGRRHVGGETTS